VLVVDFQNAVTSPDAPMGRSPLVASAIPHTIELLEAARALGAPVIFCATWFEAGKQDMPPWKITAMDAWVQGSWDVQIDDRLWRDRDVLVVKKAPSIFFGTPVSTILTKAGVDTVILAGANTSGCIRASTIDSFSHGFRTILPRECVADQGAGPHEANLRDVGIRYADVVAVEDVLSYLAGLSAAAASSTDPADGRLPAGAER
jgi:maleamate amidohydrolase